MRTISIYYICTGKYIMFLDEFSKRLQSFMPGDKKNLVIITDCGEDLIKKYSGLENMTVYQHYIQHFPWPIVTLFKMKHILDCWHDADFAFYLNANLMVGKGCGFEAMDGEMIFSQHWIEYLPYSMYNKRQLPESCSYIDYKDIPSGLRYCQGAFFGGDAKLMKDFCEDICWMVREDLLKNIIPTWHDESYLNKWVYRKFKSGDNKHIRIVHMRDVGELIDKDIDKSKL